jgi:serine/threonine-protein kinase
MRVCPLCHARYDDDVRSCPQDGRRPLPEASLSAAAGDALMGCTLANRYTIVGRVGAGGMGTVYRAEQSPMNREVALKVLRKDLGRDPETVARFHREAHTLSALKHPNTVTIFDFGQTDDGLLYLAMELLEGEMLSSRLKRVGAMDVSTSIRIAAGVLRSLAEAHSRGIIHRDLKPDNIFLAKVHGRPEEDEVVKVVDFGIAKIRDGEGRLEPLQTQEGTVFGTPRYMSPEQAQGKTLDGRSDLYAVGVLLFHMLTGHPPFTDDDAVIVMAHHIKTVPAPVRQLVPDRAIPESLEKLVQRALEKDAIARPQTAELFLIELEQTLEEAKALAASTLAPSDSGRAVPPAVTDTSKPRRRMALGAVLGGVLAITIGAIVATRGRPHPAANVSAAAATPASVPAPNTAHPVETQAPVAAPSPVAMPAPQPTVADAAVAAPVANAMDTNAANVAAPGEDGPPSTAIEPNAGSHTNARHGHSHSGSTHTHTRTRYQRWSD